MDYQDCTIHLTDVFNPCKASKSSPRIISLPPVVACQEPISQARLVKNVCISCSPNQDDCVVAVKFWGPQLSLCRPGLDSKWTNIETCDSYFYTSDVMYSKRDRMFYLSAYESHYTGAWYLNTEPKFQKLRFCNLPEMPKSELEALDSCIKREHLVESASGEFFIVKWYAETEKDEVMHYKTKQFMVFRREETRGETCPWYLGHIGQVNACYTEDIGDLCIFLGKGEAFCLEASKYPGLKPNSIYYIVHGVGVDVVLGGCPTSLVHVLELDDKYFEL